MAARVRARQFLLAVAAALLVAVPCALGACSHNSAASLGDDWSEEAKCVACHAVEGESLSDSACQISTSHESVTCVTCHVVDAKLEKAHAGATQEGAARLESAWRATVSDEACLACHADYAEKDVPDLVDADGKRVNAHEVPATHTHNQELRCASCHDMHGRESVEASSEAYCISCHHNKIYSCGNCHDV